MKNRLLKVTQLLLISLLSLSCSLQAGTLYKWVDNKGNTQYGDSPPSNVNAQAVKLPDITVVDNYADQWKPMDFASETKQKEAKHVPNNNRQYSQLSFLAPKANQAIRANDGDVSAMISVKPALKKGHFIQFAIDGKAVKKGQSRTANFSNLARGGHSISAKIVNAKGAVLKQSSVSFNVLRFSKLNKVDSNTQQLTNNLQQAKTYEEAKKELLAN